MVVLTVAQWVNNLTAAAWDTVVWVQSLAGCSGLKDLALNLCCSCGLDSIPGPGTSICPQIRSLKKKKKLTNGLVNSIVNYLSLSHTHTLNYTKYRYDQDVMLALKTNTSPLGISGQRKSPYPLSCPRLSYIGL